MRQMILLVLVILLTTYCYGHKLCEPFGLRVFYSDVLTNPDSASKILVYFNTDTVCEKSYVQVVTKTKLIRVPCPGIVVNISFKNGSSYQTVVHQCPID